MNFRDILGGFLVLAFIGATAVLSWTAIPPENEQLLAYMLGQLSGFVAGVIGYHYITKAGEKELDQLRTENTGKALDAISAAAAAAPHAEPPLNDGTRPAGTADDPVHVEENDR